MFDLLGCSMKSMSFFQLQRFLLYQMTLLQSFLGLIRIVDINCILVYWLIFESEQLSLVGLNLTSHSEMLLTVCNYQLHYTQGMNINMPQGMFENIR